MLLLFLKVWWFSIGIIDGEWYVFIDIFMGWIWVRWIGFFFNFRIIKLLNYFEFIYL